MPCKHSHNHSDYMDPLEWEILSELHALQAFSQPLWLHGSIRMRNSLRATLGLIAMNIKHIRNSALIQCIWTLPSIEIKKFSSFLRNMNDFEMVSTSYIYNVLMVWITCQKWQRNKNDIFRRESKHKIPCEYTIQLDLVLSIPPHTLSAMVIL